jgi:lipopolysaccharide/colanic/teichoic acid biosynthesis glycosyltransferase
VKDSRIIPGREWMRKTHFDELPNLYSYFILRNLDFVGIRPKSKDDWKPFSKYHIKKALQFKPGLNGAIYAYTNLRDFQDLQDAEMEYILKKEKNPIKTDLEYFSKIIYNKTILMEKSK